MKPLERAYFPAPAPGEDEAKATQLAEASGFPYHEVLQPLQLVREQEVWMNDIYQVNVRRGRDHVGGPNFHTVVALSIKRIDKQPITDWRDKQEIKNQLVGPECEGIELYPAESRVVDTANQYWVWCIDDPTFRFRYGFEIGLKSTESGGGAVQRYGGKEL